MKKLILQFLILAVISSTVLAQVSGGIWGVVYDAESGDPLPNAEVIVLKTGVGTITADDGKYALKLKPGVYEIQAKYLGYESLISKVNVVSGKFIKVDFFLRPTTITFEEITVTGGDSRSVFRINRIEHINAASVRNLYQLLQARIPGLNVIPNGGKMIDEGKLYFRGPVSATRGITPVIYLDGIRIDTYDLEDLNPFDIEKIEVIKGAAAATLYGTGASAGVILIYTKQ